MAIFDEKSKEDEGIASRTRFEEEFAASAKRDPSCSVSESEIRAEADKGNLTRLRNLVRREPWNVIIISRHEATITWIASQFGEGWHVNPEGRLESAPKYKSGDGDKVKVIRENATDGQVGGRVVIGNIPIGMASLARQIYAVEFAGEPPRGREYTVDDMNKAAARLRAYRVEYNLSR